MSEAVVAVPLPHLWSGPDVGVTLVGNPNVGKSALFGRLTGRYVTVSNYPGTTVERIEGTAEISGTTVQVLDTPGANSFIPSSEDERVTRDVLLDGQPRVVVAVGDAKNLERTVRLALQLCEMRLPFVLALNMSDESRSRGIRVDVETLATRLGVEVIPTVAVTGEGISELKQALVEPSVSAAHISYPAAVEAAVVELIPCMPTDSLAPRALALMALAGEATFDEWLRARMSATSWHTVAAARLRCASTFAEPLSYLLNRSRHEATARTIESIESREAHASSPARRIAARLETIATHPLWGLPMLGAVLYLAYLFVGVFGADTMVGLLEDGLFNGYVNPWSTKLIDAVVPWGFLRDLLVGPYGVITMALTYSLALVLPIVGTFFIAFGVLEDSGYLPRLAVMVNRLFKRMGLNGKAVLPMILGLGCDTMATLTTRILETKKERLIVILLLALGVPCSAQLTVVLTMLGSLSAAAMWIWIGVVAATILFVGALAARVLPGRGSDFVLELPPMRLPRPGNILVKTLARIEWYLKEAVPLFILGTLILFVADRLQLLGGMQRLAEPILTGWLGLPKETAPAFIVGFLRRDFGAAGLYHMFQDGQLDSIAVVVSVVTITLFIPCIANFFMMVKERGWKTGLAIAGFVFPFALAVGAGLNWLLRALNVSF